jgi:hypothetical protein
LKFDKIRDEARDDLQYDQTDLAGESARIPYIHNKWMKILTNEKMVLKQYNFELAKLRRIKWEYYTGKTTRQELQDRGWEPFPLKILKQDLDKYLDADEDLHALEMKRDHQKSKVEFVEETVKQINQRQWSIRNMIEWFKFTNGVN